MPNEKGILTEEWNKPEPFFEFEKKDRDLLIRKLNPRRLLDDKKQQSSVYATSRGLVTAVYQNAIEVSRNENKLRGFATISGLIFLPMPFMFGYGIYAMGDEPVIWAIGLPAVILTLLASVFFFLCEFIPRQYLLFNKKERTVSFQMVRPPSFFSPWKKVSRPFVTYSWDTLRARTYSEIQVVGGKLPRQRSSLHLLWGDEPEHPRRLKVSVAVGSKTIDDVLQVRTWEHIRRYMEEAGPPLGQGESLGAAQRTRVTPPFPTEVLAAAGPPVGASK